VLIEEASKSQIRGDLDINGTPRNVDQVFPDVAHYFNLK
jgi:hypothetical protein